MSSLNSDARRAMIWTALSVVLCLSWRCAWGDLPKPENIVAFANNPRVQYFTGAIMLQMSQDQFFEFLNRGKVVKGKSLLEMIQSGPMTFPPDIAQERREEIRLLIENHGTAAGLLLCEGVAATDRELYFWRLLNDVTLCIENGKDQAWFLHLDK